jgi:cyclohexanecarboxyl-CoA dehydrogenase
MNFAFTEDQAIYRQTIRKFAQKEILPRRKEWDLERKYPRPIARRAAELGLVSPFVSYVHTGIAIEEVAYVDFNCAFPVLSSQVTFEMFNLPGVPEDVARPFREGMAAGEKNISICFTEPEAGSDFANIATTATRTGDSWVINGCKNSVSNAGVSEAYLVWAKTETIKSVWGVTAFLVPCDAPGVSAPVLYDDMGTLGTPRGVVYFDDVHIPADYVVGVEGRGFELAADLYDTNRALIGLMCIGPAQASVDETVEYAKQRVTFGRPISKNQAISFALAEAHTLLEAGRLLCYKTLWMADEGIRHSAEGAMCKWWVPQTSFDIVRKCLLFHGHYGYTKDFPFEQRLRDILGWQTGDGTGEVSKLIIARKLFGGKEFTG